jgi:hypothetical protein
MTTDALMPNAYRSVLYKKYNILGHIEFKYFDQNFLLLEEYLLTRKKSQFDPRDRFILVHMDLDYYFEDFPFGINFYNTFTTFRKLDIPLYTMLFFTNHFGIEKEIDKLIDHPADRPTVISSFITTVHYSNSYQPTNIDADQVTMPALSLMNTPRSHRFGLYNFLQENDLLTHTAVSIRSQ